MNPIEIILISISASIDALLVSMVKGIDNKKIKIKKMLLISFIFGLFQFIMPILGLILGIYLDNYIYKYSVIIASLLLFYIGISMIFKKDELNGNLLILAFLTSIDAFSIGLSYFLGYGKVNYLITFISIGIITFINCNIGYYIGFKLKKVFNNFANLIGGIILILIGIKLITTHFF